MHIYSTNPQARHTSDDADLEVFFDGPERELTEADKALIDSICADVDAFVAEQPDEQQVAPAAVPASSLQAAFAGWRTKDAADRAKLKALNALLKPLPRPAEQPANPAPSIQPSLYSEFLGVSERTVRRRKRKGVAASDLFKPVHEFEHGGFRYSANQFAHEFGISRRVVFAGIKAGKSGDEILASRRPRGRPSRAN